MAITENDVRAAAPANAPEDVIKWVAEVAAITTPDKVEFSDGSQAEWARLPRWLAWNPAPLSVAKRKRTPVPPTTGVIPKR